MLEQYITCRVGQNKRTKYKTGKPSTPQSSITQAMYHGRRECVERGKQEGGVWGYKQTPNTKTTTSDNLNIQTKRCAIEKVIEKRGRETS